MYSPMTALPVLPPTATAVSLLSGVAVMMRLALLASKAMLADSVLGVLRKLLPASALAKPTSEAALLLLVLGAADDLTVASYAR